MHKAKIFLLAILPTLTSCNGGIVPASNRKDSDDLIYARETASKFNIPFSRSSFNFISTSPSDLLKEMNWFYGEYHCEGQFYADENKIIDYKIEANLSELDVLITKDNHEYRYKKIKI